MTIEGLMGENKAQSEKAAPGSSKAETFASSSGEDTKNLSETKHSESDEKLSEPLTENMSDEDPSTLHADKKKAKHKRIWIHQSRFEELEKKAQESQVYLDHLQRLQAEFDNFRKRSQKDREDFRKAVLEDFLFELIGILDNFERALEASQNAKDLSSVVTGVQMIYRQFSDCLGSRGVTPIEAVGHDFDPSKHDAISFEESKDAPPHQVIAQFTRGYMLHGKVIRPSKVKVSKEVSSAPPDPASA